MKAGILEIDYDVQGCSFLSRDRSCSLPSTSVLVEYGLIINNRAYHSCNCGRDIASTFYSLHRKSVECADAE